MAFASMFILAILAIMAMIVVAPIVVGTLLSIHFLKKPQFRYILWGLGLLGLVLSVIFLQAEIKLSTILIYWGIYFGCIWLVPLVVQKVRKHGARNREE